MLTGVQWGEKSTSEMLVEEKEATQEYTIPNEVNNMLMLFKKNIEEVDQEGFGQDRVNRIVPEYKLFNEELNLPTPFRSGALSSGAAPFTRGAQKSQNPPTHEVRRGLNFVRGRKPD